MKRFLPCLALVLSTAGSRAAIPAPERLLPDDTLIVFTAPDFGKVREMQRTSPQSQLWDDPAIKPFRDKFMSKLKKDLIEPLERDLGFSLETYADLPQGQITLALIQNGWHGSAEQPPGVLFLLDAKDKSSQLKANLALARKKWIDAGKSIRTEKIRDIEFSILPLSEKDVPATLRKIFASEDEETSEGETNKAPKIELVFGQFESLLIAGNSTKAVEKVAAHLTGGSAPALADLSVFEANRLSMFRDSPFYGWVHVKPFVDMLLHAQTPKDGEAENGMELFTPDKFVNAMGLGGLKSLAFTVQNSSDGVLLQFFAGVPESGRKGLFQLFPASARESGPPPFVPADTVKFQRVRLDCQRAWAALEKFANDLSPGRLNMVLEMANAAAKEKDPSFDIRKGFIGNLGDDMVSYQKAPVGNAISELASPPSLFLLGSPHPDQVAASLKLLASLMGGQGAATEREFLGRKIISIPVPSYLMMMLGGDPSAKGARQLLNLAASGGYLAMATDTSILEEYLRSSESTQKRLRDKAGLAEAMAKVGGSSTGWFGYENQAETSRAAFEVLRRVGSSKDSEKPASAGGLPPFTAENPLKDWFDFSLLPPFEKIAKYFYFTVYAGSSTPEGLMFKVFYPVPPQLKK